MREEYLSDGAAHDRLQQGRLQCGAFELSQDAKTLTDADIEQFAIVDPPLAECARARRQGFVPAETELERKHNALPVTRRDVTEAIQDVLLPGLATHRYKFEQLEAQITTMSKQLEEARSEINYLRWAREQDTAKI